MIPTRNYRQRAGICTEYFVIRLAAYLVLRHSQYPRFWDIQLFGTHHRSGYYPSSTALQSLHEIYKIFKAQAYSKMKPHSVPIMSLGLPIHITTSILPLALGSSMVQLLSSINSLETSFLRFTFIDAVLFSLIYVAAKICETSIFDVHKALFGFFVIGNRDNKHGLQRLFKGTHDPCFLEAAPTWRPLIQV